MFWAAVYIAATTMVVSPSGSSLKPVSGAAGEPGVVRSAGIVALKVQAPGNVRRPAAGLFAKVRSRQMVLLSLAGGKNRGSSGLSWRRGETGGQGGIAGRVRKTPLSPELRLEKSHRTVKSHPAWINSGFVTAEQHASLKRGQRGKVVHSRAFNGHSSGTVPNNAGRAYAALGFHERSTGVTSTRGIEALPGVSSLPLLLELFEGQGGGASCRGTGKVRAGVASYPGRQEFSHLRLRVLRMYGSYQTVQGYNPRSLHSPATLFSLQAGEEEQILAASSFLPTGLPDDRKTPEMGRGSGISGQRVFLFAVRDPMEPNGEGGGAPLLYLAPIPFDHTDPVFSSIQRTTISWKSCRKNEV